MKYLLPNLRGQCLADSPFYSDKVLLHFLVGNIDEVRDVLQQSGFPLLLFDIGLRLRITCLYRRRLLVFDYKNAVHIINCVMNQFPACFAYRILS